MRTALVTGASRGIGAAITRSLLERGMRVICVGRRPTTELTEAELAIVDVGDATYLAADVSEADGRAAIVAAVRSEGGVDVLVNNAGIAPSARQDPLEADEADFRRLLDVNLVGAHLLTRDVAACMLDASSRDRRTIITITSVSAELASPDRAGYCIAKAGLSMANKVWAVRLAGDGIDCVEVRPGVISTDMTAGVADRYDGLIEGGLSLERRWGTPEDVARVVTALAAGEITFATGQVFTVDGGLSVPRL